MQLKNKEKPASSNNTSQLLGTDAQATASVISGWNTIIRLQVSVWLIVLGTVIASQWKRIWEEEAEWTMKRQIKYYSQHITFPHNFCPIFAVMWTVKNICLHQHLLLCANFPPTLHCLLNDSSCSSSSPQIWTIFFTREVTQGAGIEDDLQIILHQIYVTDAKKVIRKRVHMLVWSFKLGAMFLHNQAKGIGFECPANLIVHIRMRWIISTSNATL